MKNLFSFFMKLFSGSSVRLGKEEPNTPPPAYSPGGLSSEFIEKYGLSGRQAEVAEVLLQGKSDREIAALLDIALNTVQVHLKKIYRKTGTRGRYALMALVRN